MSELKLQQCRVDGRYDVLDCLGRGSYSEVYVARDLAAAEGSPQMVVIKALNPYLQGVPDTELEQTLIENFRNEAVALDRVRHPNIISRLGHGTAIDLHDRVFHYLVLEYLPGGDMQQLCRRRPLKLEGALFYIRQVCSGLEHAHERGVIHRDIKPQNLLLTADQHLVKIADFGVAKLEANDGAITRVGTDIYAAPEHHPLRQTGPLDTASLVPPGRHLTPAADIYSLAKTSYMLLTGESPRRFSQRPVTEFPEAFAREPWAGYVLRVIERATQTNPARRHQTVREYWDELQDASMPKTRVLGQAARSGNGAGVPAGGDALDDEIHVTPAPPAPSFPRRPGPAEERLPHPSHLRIVVPVAVEPRQEVAPPARKHAPAPRAAAPAGSDDIRPREARSAGRRIPEGLRKWLVALVLIGAFAGMLLATHTYFKRAPRPTAPATPPGGPTAVGRELFARTDVNLRSAASGASEKIGLIPAGSAVKVLGVEGGWYKVQVVQFSRPKESGMDAEQGWADRNYFRERQ
jgi:serine/threonine protein kinase